VPLRAIARATAEGAAYLAIAVGRLVPRLLLRRGGLVIRVLALLAVRHGGRADASVSAGDGQGTRERDEGGRKGRGIGWMEQSGVDQLRNPAEQRSWKVVVVVVVVVRCDVRTKDGDRGSTQVMKSLARFGDGGANAERLDGRAPVSFLDTLTACVSSLVWCVAFCTRRQVRVLLLPQEFARRRAPPSVPPLALPLALSLSAMEVLRALPAHLSPLSGCLNGGGWLGGRRCCCRRLAEQPRRPVAAGPPEARKSTSPAWAQCCRPVLGTLPIVPK